MRGAAQAVGEAFLRSMARPVAVAALGVVGVVLAATERPVEAQVHVTSCDPKQLLCGGKCVPRTPQTGCSSCTPCQVVGASSTCEGSGKDSRCGYTACMTDRIDLDGDRTNGCEALVTNYLVFRVPAAFMVSSSTTATTYEFSGIAGGRWRQEGELRAMPQWIQLQVGGPRVSEAIARCLSLTATAPSKVWLEVFNSGIPSMIQRSPGTARVEIPEATPATVQCYVNREPPTH